MEDRKLPLWQAVLWVLLGGFAAQLAGAFVASVVQSLLAARGAVPEEVATDAVVVVPSIVVSGLCLTGVALLAPALAGLPARRALGLRAAPPLCYGAAAFGTVMLGPVADVLMRVMEQVLPEFTLDVVPMLQQVVRGVPVVLALLVFAVVPGISEELMFRGLLQNAVRGRVLPIVVSGFGFALFHVDPHHVAGVLPLGLFLAWVASRCGTLVTMFAHAANNAAAVAAAHSPTFDVGYGTDKPMPWEWVPVSLVLVASAALLIARATPAPSVPAHSGQ